MATEQPQVSESTRSEAIRMVTQEGKSQGEVSRILGVNKGTVSKWISRAREGRAPVAPVKGAPVKLAPVTSTDDPVALRARIRELESLLAESREEARTLRAAIGYVARPAR